MSDESVARKCGGCLGKNSPSGIAKWPEDEHPCERFLAQGLH